METPPQGKKWWSILFSCCRSLLPWFISTVVANPTMFLSTFLIRLSGLSIRWLVYFNLYVRKSFSSKNLIFKRRFDSLSRTEILDALSVKEPWSLADKMNFHWHTFIFSFVCILKTVRYKLPPFTLHEYNSFQDVKHKLLGMVDIDEDKIYDLIVQVQNDWCMKWKIVSLFPFPNSPSGVHT